MLRKAYITASVVLMLVAMGAAMTGCPEDVTAQYQVTITNLTPLQTYAPLVAVTHSNDITLFRENDDASNIFTTFVEDEVVSGLLAALDALDAVTDVYTTDTGVGLPLTAAGTITFEIQALTSDLFSIAAIPSLELDTDSFVGIDSVPLPFSGTRIYYLDNFVLESDGNVALSSGLQNVVQVTITKE